MVTHLILLLSGGHAGLEKTSPLFFNLTSFSFFALWKSNYTPRQRGVFACKGGHQLEVILASLEEVSTEYVGGLPELEVPQSA